MTNQQKNILVSLSVVAAFFFALTAHAQVAIIGAPVQASYCPAYDIAGSDASNPNQILVNSGQIPAITGNYSYSTNCDSSTQDETCATIQGAVDSAVTQGNSIDGFPQGTTGQSNDSITVQVGDYATTCSGALSCEATTQTVLADGSVSINASIYLNTGYVLNGTNVLLGDVIANNPGLALQMVEHGMSHGFGLGDSRQAGSLMSPINFGISDASPLTWLNDPTNSAGAIEEINDAGVDGQALTLDDEGGSCSVTCSDGQIAGVNPYSPDGTQCSGLLGATTTDSCLQINDDGAGNIACTMDGGVVCACNGNPSNGNPTVPAQCFDENNNKMTTPPAGACIAPDPDPDSATSSGDLDSDSEDPFSALASVSVDGLNFGDGLDDYLNNYNGLDPNMYGGNEVGGLDGAPSGFNDFGIGGGNGDGGGGGGGGGGNGGGNGDGGGGGKTPCDDAFYRITHAACG